MKNIKYRLIAIFGLLIVALSILTHETYSGIYLTDYNEEIKKLENDTLRIKLRVDKLIKDVHFLDSTELLHVNTYFQHEKDNNKLLMSYEKEKVRTIINQKEDLKKEKQKIIDELNKMDLKLTSLYNKYDDKLYIYHQLKKFSWIGVIVGFLIYGIFFYIDNKK